MVTDEQMARAREWLKELRYGCECSMCVGHLADRIAERDGELVSRLREENVRMEAALKRIDGWDMLNPPNPETLGDVAWLRRVVNEGLGK